MTKHTTVDPTCFGGGEGGGRRGDDEGFMTEMGDMLQLPQSATQLVYSGVVTAVLVLSAIEGY